jgi:hypothetical protein
MLQRNSDLFLSRPMIYFGSSHQADEENGEDETMQSLILEINPKCPLHQDIGLYFLWSDS